MRVARFGEEETKHKNRNAERDADVRARACMCDDNRRREDRQGHPLASRGDSSHCAGVPADVHLYPARSRSLCEIEMSVAWPTSCVTVLQPGYFMWLLLCLSRELAFVSTTILLAQSKTREIDRGMLTCDLLSRGGVSLTQLCTVALPSQKRCAMCPQKRCVMTHRSSLLSFRCRR